MTRSTATITFGVLLLIGAAPLIAQTVPSATPEQEAKLIAVLKSEGTLKEKVDACRQLAAIGTKEAVPALAALLGDEKLSHMARYGLEPIPDPSVDDALRDALGRLKGRSLVGVIGSLGVRRDAQAVAPLTSLLKDPDPTAAQAAARALGRIGTPDAGQTLQAALPKAPEDRRLAVAEGCLICAEALLAQGKLTEAAAVYKDVSEAELPKHFRVAAVQGMILVQQTSEAP